MLRHVRTRGKINPRNYMTPRRNAATADDFDHDDAVLKKKVACKPDMKPDVSLRAKPQFLEQAHDWTLVYDEDNVTLRNTALWPDVVVPSDDPD